MIQNRAGLEPWHCEGDGWTNMSRRRRVIARAPPSQWQGVGALKSARGDASALSGGCWAIQGGGRGREPFQARNQQCTRSTASDKSVFGAPRRNPSWRATCQTAPERRCGGREATERDRRERFLSFIPRHLFPIQIPLGGFSDMICLTFLFYPNLLRGFLRHDLPHIPFLSKSP